jgi:hypothetical protein
MLAPSAVHQEQAAHILATYARGILVAAVVLGAEPHADAAVILIGFLFQVEILAIIWKHRDNPAPSSAL